MLMTTLYVLTLMSLCVVSRRIDSLSLRSISQIWIENRCGTDLRVGSSRYAALKVRGADPGDRTQRARDGRTGRIWAPGRRLGRNKFISLSMEAYSP